MLKAGLLVCLLLLAQPVCPLTPQEQVLVESVIATEARGESLIGQMAVAQVIRDRALGWDETPEQVLNAPGQFASPYTGTTPMLTRVAVYRVFALGQSVFDRPVYHFYSQQDVYPYWAPDKTLAGVIEHHTFMY